MAGMAGDIKGAPSGAGFGEKYGLLSMSTSVGTGIDGTLGGMLSAVVPGDGMTCIGCAIGSESMSACSDCISGISSG